MNSKSLISCRQGWASLYEPIIEQIVEYDNRQSSVEDKIGISEIREKFGYLDIQVEQPANLISKIRRAINAAQIKSDRTCEFCGTKEKIGHTINKWRKTCCQKCWEEHIHKNQPTSVWREGECDFDDY